ncbi:hypothetical protein G7046_g11 [Stylonectria norvegica]|nr:hypothetical protein G7046_g11 [Stylonectria norvegica]
MILDLTCARTSPTSSSHTSTSQLLHLVRLLVSSILFVGFRVEKQDDTTHAPTVTLFRRGSGRGRSGSGSGSIDSKIGNKSRSKSTPWPSKFAESPENGDRPAMTMDTSATRWTVSSASEPTTY